MKYLVSALAHLRFFLIPPFAALCIWVFTSFSASLVKYVIPRLIQLHDTMLDIALTYYEGDPESSLGLISQYYMQLDDGFLVLIRFVSNWIYGIGKWVPLEIVVNTVATLFLLQIAYIIIRYVVKLVTIGQV